MNIEYVKKLALAQPELIIGKTTEEVAEGFGIKVDPSVFGKVTRDTRILCQILRYAGYKSYVRRNQGRVKRVWDKPFTEFQEV